MVIYPESTTTGRTVTERFVLAKLPVYVLYFSNWIPYKDNKNKSCRNIILAIFTTLIHTLGITCLSLYLYGILTSPFLQLAPTVLHYALISPSLLSTILGILFLCNSWNMGKTIKILNVFDQNGTPYILSKKYKVFMVFSISIVMCTIITRVYSVFLNTLSDDKLLKAVWNHFIKDDTLSYVLAKIGFLYYGYLFIIHYVYPLFISYICFCLNKIIDNLYTLLKAMKDKNETSDEYFNEFAKKFKETANLVAFIDETYRLDIGWYITISISNMICLLYLKFVFVKCYEASVTMVPLIADTSALLILMMMASSVPSNVSIYQIYISELNGCHSGRSRISHWGRRPPTWVLFGENVCGNKRIGSRRGVCAGHAPSRSANEWDLKH